MDHFDLPSPGLVVAVVMLLVVMPMAVFAFIPMAIFRTAYRRSLASWVRRGEHVVRAAYRGSTVTIETPSRVPLRVAAASVVSLYVAAPVIVIAPVALAAMAFDGVSREAALGIVGSLVMVACGVVGLALLRPSREAVLGARVLAAYELAFAIVTFGSSIPSAVVACVHAMVLFVGAAANARARASLRACT